MGSEPPPRSWVQVQEYADRRTRRTSVRDRNNQPIGGGKRIQDRSCAAFTDLGVHLATAAAYVVAGHPPGPLVGKTFGNLVAREAFP